MPAHADNINVRDASPADAEAMAWIYNQGIEERTATFETRSRTAADLLGWFGGAYPVVVVEDATGVVAFAVAFPYSPRECYSGVAEFSVYTARESRGQGAGSLAMETLIQRAQETGFWKLSSRVFVENKTSLRLLHKLGFREVGVFEKHGKLDGVWRDVAIVERLIEANLD